MKTPSVCNLPTQIQKKEEISNPKQKKVFGNGH